jgi:4-amino-4-deoxy-L-arabinose transferase-like glycosyltransferase
MQPPADNPNRSPAPAPRGQWLGLLLCALLIRGGVLLLTPDAFVADPDAYRQVAQDVLDEHCFGGGQTPTASRPPLYPLLLAACLAVDPGGRVGIGLLHLACGVATVGLVYLLGRRWGLGNYAWLAAALVAVDPILLAQSTVVMTETVAALLAALSLSCLTVAAERPPSGRRAAAAGACLALAVLCRPTFLVWMAAVGCVLPWFAAGWTSRLKWWGAFVAGAVVVLAPWAVRNRILLGRFVVGTTHGGYTLLLANNPWFYEHLRTSAWGSVWDSEEFGRAWGRRADGAQPRDEVSLDRLAYAQAWQNIRREPATALYASLVRAGRLWTPLPHQTASGGAAANRWARYAVGIWYAAELALAVMGLAVLARRAVVQRFVPPGWLAGLLLAASFTAVHTLYWSNMRMRAPLMPVVAMAAAGWVAWMATRFKR